MLLGQWQVMREGLTVPVGLGSGAASAWGQQRGQGWPGEGRQAQLPEGLHIERRVTIKSIVWMRIQTSIHKEINENWFVFMCLWPCLCPGLRDAIIIFSVAGLLRPVRICMALGSGRRPFPRFKACRCTGRHLHEHVKPQSLALNPYWYKDSTWHYKMKVLYEPQLN